MALGAISRAAKGLYGFIDLITDGIGPREQSQVLQPSLDMFPFLGAESLRVAFATVDIAAGTDTALLQLTPPVGRTWIVRSLNGIVACNAGTNAFCMDFVLAGVPLVEGGSGLAQCALGCNAPRGVVADTANPAVLSYGYQLVPPLVVVGGGPLRLTGRISNLISADTATFQLNCLVHDVPS